jgi:hypothetical protein
MEMVQTLLRQHTETGVVQEVAWLPVDLRVKKGSVVTLKDAPERGEFEVVEQYLRQDSENIQRGWGLDLPKTQRTER